MALVSNTGTLTITSGNPAWFSGNLNTWFNTPTTFASRQVPEPGPSSNQPFAYSGAALLGTRVYYFGGGHGDGCSNAIYYVDLAANVPDWTVALTTSQNPPVDVSHVGNPLRPNSRHSGYEIQAISARNRIFLFTGWAYWDPSTPVAHDDVDAFNISTQTWDPPDTYAQPTGLQTSINSPQPVCKDTAENVYIWSLNAPCPVYKWTQTTATWSVINTGATSGLAVQYNTPMAYDPVRNRVVLIDGSSSAYINLSNNQITTFSTTAQRNASFFWCGDISAFLYKEYGSTAIRRIDPVTFANTAYSVAGTPPAESGDGNNNMYGRIGWCEQLGCVYSITQTSTRLHAFRTR